MTSRTLVDRGFLLILAGGFSVALLLQAGAQTLPSDKDRMLRPLKPVPRPKVTTPAPPKPSKPISRIWSSTGASSMSMLSTLANMLRVAARSALAKPDTEMSWSSKDTANGASAVSVKQSLSPFWDARIGADMTVVNQPQTLTEADLLRQKYSPDGAPSQSSGTAWAAITAPGAGAIWDKTSVEARVDPSQEQSKLGTSLSKSLPLNEQYSLTLQNGYSLIQQGIVPVPGIIAHPMRNYQSDQSARLSIAESGTSFTASQSLSSTDDKWLRKIGAEQKLFGGVNISGSIGETPQGLSNKSLTAGFKQSW